MFLLAGFPTPTLRDKAGMTGGWEEGWGGWVVLEDNWIEVPPPGCAVVWSVEGGKVRSEIDLFWGDFLLVLGFGLRRYHNPYVAGMFIAFLI